MGHPTLTVKVRRIDGKKVSLITYDGVLFEDRDGVRGAAAPDRYDIHDVLGLLSYERRDQVLVLAFANAVASARLSTMKDKSDDGSEAFKETIRWTKVALSLVGVL